MPTFDDLASHTYNANKHRVKHEKEYIFVCTQDDLNIGLSTSSKDYKEYLDSDIETDRTKKWLLRKLVDIVLHL